MTALARLAEQCAAEQRNPVVDRAEEIACDPIALCKLIDDNQLVFGDIERIDVGQRRLHLDEAWLMALGWLRGGNHKAAAELAHRCHSVLTKHLEAEIRDKRIK